MPRGQNREYIIVIKDLHDGWEFLQYHNLDRPYCAPSWSWYEEEAQRFSQKREAQRVLDQIKVDNSCQRAVLCPVVELPRLADRVSAEARAISGITPSSKKRGWRTYNNLQNSQCLPFSENQE